MARTMCPPLLILDKEEGTTHKQQNIVHIYAQKMHQQFVWENVEKE